MIHVQYRSQIADVYRGSSQTQHPLFSMPVYHNSLCPLMCNDAPHCGQHQDYSVQYNKLIAPSSRPYFGEGYQHMQEPYWAFKNLPERISWSFADDSAQIPRSSLASMARRVLLVFFQKCHDSCLCRES